MASDSGISRRSFLGEAALLTTASVLARHRAAEASPACASVPSTPPCAGSASFVDGRLTHAEWTALTLAAKVMLPRPLPPGGPSYEDIVGNLQRFVGNADEEALADLRQGLRALGAIAPVLESDIEGAARAIDRTLRQRESSEIKTLLDSLHKVSVLGYYAHAKAHTLVGYRPPDVRPLHNTCLPVRTRPTKRTFDVAIVGAGVAGSLLAERLTAQGKSVVLLEAGPYVAEKEIDQDELVWIARLQRGSGLQQANANTDLAHSVRTFPVLQAACVGGGGMINNAVCFQMPDFRIEAWTNAGFPIAKATLRAAYRHIGAELPIVTVSKAMDAMGITNPSLGYVDFGPSRPSSVDEPPKPGLWECLVNLACCTGCGLCNTGCGSERKRNALQVYLPKALARSGLCELVPNARVERVALRRRVFGAPHRVAELEVRNSKSGETFTVRAHEYVLSAGAIHTTALLLRSPDVMSSSPHLPFGERFFVNVASPVLGFFKTPIIHTRPSLQLTHFYYPPDPNDAFLIEDLYNPPGQASLVMPGYGSKHAERMRLYPYTTLTGVVVPTTSHGKITLDKRNQRPLISLPLTDEMPRFKKALTTLAKAVIRGRGDVKPFAAIAGVVGGGTEMTKESDVERFGKQLSRFDEIALSTGHPQGGSAMSESKFGVVDRAFRVRGFANLRICDASLFPLVAGVNPQWTVMALAHCCADVMNGVTHP